jgi:HAD superfamily hydrolase (TIGR01509 family)
MIDAVVFDLDGVLIQSEELWADVRRAFVLEHGGRWHDNSARAMMGMSSIEWSRYLNEDLGVPLTPESISQEVVARMEARYRQRLPLVSGARAAVQRLAARWPLALASSANRPLIDLVLDVADLRAYFDATVSSEEVSRGKPAPDVYLEAARRLGVEARLCVAIEDSSNGIRSAKAAGMRVVAMPDPANPPDPAALAEADVTITSLDELTSDVLDPDVTGAER